MVQDIIDGIVGGLTDFIGTIGAGIVELLINLLSTLINLILLPIDALISTIFPDFSTLIINFNSTLNTVFNNSISYIMYHIPPMTKFTILFYITLLIAYYSIKYTYKAIILVPNLIQKIKFW